MGRQGDTETELVTVRLADVKELESELLTILDGMDELVRLRPLIMRLLRVVKEMDPDMTPIRHVPLDASKAYRTSSDRPPAKKSDSITFGPRFTKKK